MSMLMAKATEADHKAVLALIRNLERKESRVAPALNRIYWGFEMLCRELCDDNSKHLELKPELKEAILKAAIETAKVKCVTCGKSQKTSGNLMGNYWVCSIECAKGSLRDFGSPAQQVDLGGAS